MKNFKLLLATTAILSTVLVANVKADSLPTTTLHTEVYLLRPSFIVEEVAPLHFGAVFAKNGAIIRVDASADTTATTPTNAISADIFDPIYAGVLKISGNMLDVITTGHLNQTDQTNFVAGVEAAIDGTSLFTFSAVTPLKDGSITCGEIYEGSLVQEAHLNNKGEIEVAVGGTLVLDDEIEENMAAAKKSLACKGTITATLINVFDD